MIECEHCDSTADVLYRHTAQAWLCPTCSSFDAADCSCDACVALDYLIALGPTTYEVTS